MLKELDLAIKDMPNDSDLKMLKLKVLKFIDLDPERFK